MFMGIYFNLGGYIQDYTCLFVLGMRFNTPPKGVEFSPMDHIVKRTHPIFHTKKSCVLCTDITPKRTQIYFSSTKGRSGGLVMEL